MLPSFFTSKPVSRVLSFKTAIYLDAPLPIRSSRLLNTTGPVCCVPTALLRIEFTASRCSHVMGELLPRLSTLTSSAQAPNHSLRRMRQSSLSSLRLLSPQKHLLLRGPQWGEAVYLCCTFPGVTPGGRYPLSLPCGARTFLIDGPFAPPTRLSSLLAQSL